MPYVKELPLSQAMLVINYLRGDHQSPLPVVIEACYDVLGFGLSKVFPVDKTPLIGSVVVTEENLADVLEAHCNVDDKIVGVAVPWSLVLPVLLHVVDKLLKKYLES